MHVGGPSGDGLSWHSLRKTARTLMSRAGVRSDHAERALGHVQGAVERAYDKHEYLVEKRAAFEALAREIERVIDRSSMDSDAVLYGCASCDHRRGGRWRRLPINRNSDFHTPILLTPIYRRLRR